MAGGTDGDDELARFVREALGRGLGRDEIAAALAAAGWPAERVRRALDAYADVPFPLPVPRPPRPAPRPDARFWAADAFGYLVLFSTLLASAWAAGDILFELIERAFPFPGDTFYGFGESVRHAVATLIVSYPIFFAASVTMARSRRRFPERSDSPIRRWLTYATLFVATVCLIGNLATLVYWILAGDLTARFLLKVATVGLLSGGLLVFYGWDIRRDEAAPGGGRTVRRAALGATAIVALAVVATSLSVTDSPTVAGGRRIDERRVQQLQAIDSAVRAFWAREDRLPATLREAIPEGPELPLTDPETGTPYEYRVLGIGRFELCATFGYPSAERSTMPYGSDLFWWHGVGRHCFERRIPEPG